MDSYSKLARFAQSNKYVQESLEVIKEALLRFPPKETCISFNGGKDCTAVLHLVHSVIKSLNQDDNVKLLAFYAQLPDHFDEELNFVQETVIRYNLKLMQYSTYSLKDSLSQFKSVRPDIGSIFVGTRKDDLRPGINIDFFAPTDGDWPSFTRISPILNWSYDQVWKFLRELDIPFCDLYKQGYSSIGTKINTKKNHNLLRSDESGVYYYAPAWELVNVDEERSNRASSINDDNKQG